mgnify:FL=1
MYKISFLSNSISHEGRLIMSLEAASDEIAIAIFKEKFAVLEPYNVLIQRYISDDELKDIH